MENNLKAKTPFVVMIKPVGSCCNLSCEYCYYSKDKQPLSIMSDTILEETIKQTIEATSGDVVSFTWHGGEPTLAGIDFYKKVVILQKKYLPEGVKVWNNLQTNGTLIDENWAKFLKEEHFDVGISIDGTEWVHNEYRKDHSDFSTYRKVVKAVQILQKHGIQPDLLCTVNSSTAKNPIAVYRSLRDFNTGWIQFIPIVRWINENEVSEDSVGSKEYGEFLIQVFDEWITHDIGKTEVQLFAEMASVLHGQSSHVCWMAPVCGQVLVIEKDGSVYSCDHFVNNSYCLGNLKDVHLSKFVDSNSQKEFGLLKNKISDKCLKCPWLQLCNGGCPKDRYKMNNEAYINLNYLCAGLELFYSHAEPLILKVSKMLNKQISLKEIINEIKKELM